MRLDYISNKVLKIDDLTLWLEIDHFVVTQAI